MALNFISNENNNDAINSICIVHMQGAVSMSPNEREKVQHK